MESVIVNDKGQFWSGLLWVYLLKDAKIYKDSETDKFCDDLERLIKITNCKGVSIDDALESESF